MVELDLGSIYVLSLITICSPFSYAAAWDAKAG